MACREAGSRGLLELECRWNPQTGGTNSGCARFTDTSRNGAWEKRRSVPRRTKIGRKRKNLVTTKQ
jgi:hypothetical protein